MFINSYSHKKNSHRDVVDILVTSECGTGIDTFSSNKFYHIQLKKTQKKNKKKTTIIQS